MVEDKAFYEKVAMTKDEVEEYVSTARLARISTFNGQKPHVAPVWYLYDGKDFFISTGTRTRKVSNIRQNPNVSLVIDSTDGMFKNKCVIVEGRAELDQGAHPEITRKIYVRYLGQDGLKHLLAQELLKSERYIVIRPTKLITWDYGKAIE